LAPFQSVRDGIWWALVTVTTVGYGDLVPLSTAGRLVGAMAMLTGVVGLSSIISIMTQEMGCCRDPETGRFSHRPSATPPSARANGSTPPLLAATIPPTSCGGGGSDGGGAAQLHALEQRLARLEQLLTSVDRRLQDAAAASQEQDLPAAAAASAARPPPTAAEAAAEAAFPTAHLPVDQF